MDVLRTDAELPSSTAVDEGRKRIGKHARIDFADPEIVDLSRDQLASACCDAGRDSAAGVSTQGVDQDVALGEIGGEPQGSDKNEIRDSSLNSTEKADSAPRRKERNESFDCIRLIAFVGVIFLHLNVTIDMATNETMGSINAVVRFAVPYFFAITGFFLCKAEPYAMGWGFRKEVVFVACSVAAYLIASYYGFWQWQGVGTSAPASLFFESDWVPDFLKWEFFRVRIPFMVLVCPSVRLCGPHTLEILPSAQHHLRFAGSGDDGVSHVPVRIWRSGRLFGRSCEFLRFSRLPLVGFWHVAEPCLEAAI